MASSGVKEGRHDLVEVLDRLRLLDLRDDGQEDALLLHHPAYVVGVLGRPHERQRDEVDGLVQRPAEILDVLLRQRRHRHSDAGKVDALVVAEPAADHDLGHHVGVIDRDDLQPDLAVVDEDRVARGHVAGQPVVRRAAGLDVAGHLARGDREPVTTLHPDRPTRKGVQPDLRPLQVGEDADAVP